MTYFLHHDNARPHCSCQTTETLRRLKFEVVSHPPYSPNFAPSDFWQFPKVKETLKGQDFSSDDKIQAAVWEWIRNRHVDFFLDRMKKMD